MKFMLVWKKTMIDKPTKWWGPDGSWLDSPEGARSYETREAAVVQRRAVAKRSGTPEAQVWVREVA